MKKQPFTEKEQVIMENIKKVWNDFLELERMHPMETQEFITHIHGLQSIMSHRALKRDYPKYFK